MFEKYTLTFRAVHRHRLIDFEFDVTQRNQYGHLKS